MTLTRFILIFWGIATLFAAGFALTRLPLPDKTAREAIGEQIIFTPDDPAGSRNSFKLEYYASGPTDGPKVVLLPSKGREASDFNELVLPLNTQGYRTLAIEHLGVGKTSEMNPDLISAAYPIFKALENENYLTDKKPYYLIGHGHGGRISRVAATYLTQGSNKISGVILLGADGQVTQDPETISNLDDIFNPLKSYKSRMDQVRMTYFLKVTPFLIIGRKGGIPKLRQLKAVSLTTTNCSAQARFRC